MSESMIKQRVRSIAQSYGPFAARMWIVENLHDPEDRAIAFAALMNMVA